MKNIIFLISILTALFMGCQFREANSHPLFFRSPRTETPRKIIPVYIDNSFTKKDKESIKEAINKWNDALNGYIILKLERSDCEVSNSLIEKAEAGQIYLIMKVNDKYPFIKAHDNDKEYPTVAIVNDIGGNIIYLVRNRMKESDVLFVMLHEMGHLLGAHHTNHYLMRPHYNKQEYQCIDILTIEEVADYWKIPPDNFNYCLY